MSKQLLTKDFLAKYPDFPRHMDELGKFVYYRTYSRWIPELKRRETWKETVTRAVEYNCSLVDAVTKEEAEKLFDNIFNLRQFLSGRTLWIGGTEAAKKFPMANFNCSFVVVDDFEAIDDIFYLLMLGTGTGFRILKSDVDKLPRVRTHLPTEFKPYNPTPKHKRAEHTSLAFEGDKAIIKVGDSKEGWVQSLSFYLRLFWDKKYRNVQSVLIDFDDVRPKGERLETFGGTASGHESLKNMFEKIHDVLTTDRFAPKPVNGKLRPIHILDICNIIGENVVVGGVRRTAENALLDADDEETILAKKDIHLYPDKYHRFLSNNSIYYTSKPSWEKIKWQFDVLKEEGEPCFLNAEAAQKRRPNFNGVNPCFEILLDSRGLCNLTTVNVLAFVKDGKLDMRGLLEAQRLSARASYRMTNVTLELHKWDEIQKRDRLLGCSLTGWKDAMEALGYDSKKEAELLRKLKEVARKSADEYADSLGLNRPLLVTTVKPEGTLSQLCGGVSSGLHHTHAPHYIRRIRINAHDPLLKTVEELGWATHNEVGQGEFVNGRYVPVTTKVIDFPVKSPVSRTKYDVTAIEQLETYYRFQENYTEHNSSNTISIKDGEWEDVVKNVWEFWDDMVAVSFLKLDNHVYELAPYETVDKKQYQELKSKMKPFDPELLQKYENGDDFDLGNEGCEGGACPIR
ncbi:ribonucleoside-triphosphate reductase, adenosylcobalamin-dependent [Thermoactinomyces intermedius]|uniref:Adenosylcobalamin-dependent ribonucleoside-triphosphate reductase n=2 Tax=Thermoactinomyces TaxID=2023 RepID=A0A8I1A771_THEIN|nr:MULTISPECIES: ribonucleoside-triphosphate reductase, adenosylcobalamin-dependent [Thermoactinomyces]MBA4547721.1 ribonucleoside-triphosphate reductase, adenosylcobalamin-dependent [Thermoactinomyces intermedius]MBA4552599.1 ribonucleoside-triphosphate reductase, adenosylcobalamin-dependent [Thermoactinomyces vulgaris]MBA4836405.1 ribonucleoside-triphosphate reductase, adenosylcobalamin-dependent [Thermoactinomyces intermedius]MBH8589745.1 ribonucleoside-triphosphate reductase, adenosylcobala